MWDQSPQEDVPWGWSRSTLRTLAILAGSLAIGLGGTAWNPAVPEVEAPALPALVVNPNTAPPEVLLALPRLGPTLVGRIVEAREVEPFASAFDLQTRVKGIGPATLAALEPSLTFGPAEPTPSIGRWVVTHDPEPTP